MFTIVLWVLTLAGFPFPGDLGIEVIQLEVLAHNEEFEEFEDDW